VIELQAKYLFQRASSDDREEDMTLMTVDSTYMMTIMNAIGNNHSAAIATTPVVYK
jgi:hypothetical protein